MEGPEGAAQRPAAGDARGPVLSGIAFALLTDGSTAEIRSASAADAEAVRQMHAVMSPDNLYLRFFSLSPSAADQEAQRVCRTEGPGHAALVAWLEGRLVGVASYEAAQDNGTAEVAFAVPDDMHGRGIATLLLEHLVSLARGRGLTAFTASTLRENSAMLRVFAAAGLPVQRAYNEDVVELTFPLPDAGPGPERDDYLDRVASRESRADVASLRPVLQPQSVAVIGTSRRPRTAGHAILRNLVTGGFAGRIYVVDPGGGRGAGVPCLASVSDLPEPVDLAVIAVPAPDVPEVAAACGRRGVRALVVISPSLGAGDASLLAICRRHGMRLIGPDSLGIMVPADGLNATIAAAPAAAGTAGLVTQSGGVGLALLSRLSRLGIGISSFASVGDKYDISSNDLLMWWEQDGGTQLAVLYVESFGSPRKFARTARRVACRMPVLTVLGGRPAEAPSAGAATAAAAALVTQEALFGQAGVIATHSLNELTQTAALLACQPLPAGNRVAIVSNGRGPGVLAANACRDHGLQVAGLSSVTRRVLGGLLPPGADVRGPTITTAGVTAGAFRACLTQAAADEGVDAILAVTVPTALCGLEDVITAATAGKPLVLVRLDQAQSVQILGSAPGVPAYADPEGAVLALAHAARYQAWRGRPQDHGPVSGGVRTGAARELAGRYLAGHPRGGWLPPGDAGTLLAYYGIHVARSPGGPGPAAKAEFRISVTQEPVFGPLLVLELGRSSAGLLSDSAVRLTPLTPADADDMITGLRAAPVLLGRRGDRPIDTAALAGLLVQVSRLADDVPEITELDLDPVLARPDGIGVAAARVRVSAAGHTDPFLRRLR